MMNTIMKMDSGQSSMMDGHILNGRNYHGYERTMDGSNQIGVTQHGESRMLKELMNRNRSHHQHKNLNLMSPRTQHLIGRF